MSLDNLEMLVNHGCETLVLDGGDNRDPEGVLARYSTPCGRRQNAVSW